MHEHTALRKRLQRPVFWGSILLNVVLIALLIIGPHHLLSSPRPPSPDLFLKRAGADLSGKDKEIFDILLAKHQPALRARGDEVMLAFRALAQESIKKQFDAEHFKLLHQQMDGQKIKMDAEISDFVIELMSELSREGRQHLKLFPKTSEMKPK